jgi:hypothetical protein
MVNLAVELKERLEDEQEAVMLEAIKCSPHYFNYIQETDYEERMDVLIDCLVLHMDSDSHKVRQLILETLQKLPGWLKARLEVKVEQAVLSHSHQEEVKQLAASLKSGELRPCALEE